MSRVLQAAVEGKGLELQSQMEALQDFIRTAVATGLAVHEVEQGLFKRLLALGYELQQWFFALLGNGDQGETVTTGERPAPIDNSANPIPVDTPASPRIWRITISLSK
jgi:hypothetical protein